MEAPFFATRRCFLRRSDFRLSLTRATVFLRGPPPFFPIAPWISRADREGQRHPALSLACVDRPVPWSGPVPLVHDVLDSARALFRAELWRMLTTRGFGTGLGLLVRGRFDPGSIFRMHAASRGERIAIIEGERVTTYAELNARACRLASF